MIRGVVFDLDDVLCLESEYARSGFCAVAAAVGQNEERCELYAGFLLDSFNRGFRGNNFDQLLATFPEVAERFKVADLVSLYRSHTPEIQLQPGLQSLLQELRGVSARLGVISDGPLLSQQNKAAALHLTQYFDLMVLTDAWGVEYWKPHSRSFEFVKEEWGLSPAELAYVGDNPTKDFVTPKRIGWQTIQLRQAAHLRGAIEPASWEYAAAAEVHSVEELRELLLRWCGGEVYSR
jgi:putative hydrolase of the HAD superfamily